MSSDHKQQLVPSQLGYTTNDDGVWLWCYADGCDWKRNFGFACSIDEAHEEWTMHKLAAHPVHGYVTCPRCKGISSMICEQGRQACTDCGGKGKIRPDARGWDGKPLLPGREVHEPQEPGV